MIIAIMIALFSVSAADRIKSTIVKQIRDSRRFRMEHVTLWNCFDSAIIIANPAAVSDVKNISDIMSFAGFFSIMIDHGKQFVLFLFLLVFVFRRN